MLVLADEVAGVDLEDLDAVDDWWEQAFFLGQLRWRTRRIEAWEIRRAEHFGQLGSQVRWVACCSLIRAEILNHAIDLLFDWLLGWLLDWLISRWHDRGGASRVWEAGEDGWGDIRLHERVANAVVHGSVDHGLIAEADFELCGVDIDIHSTRRHLDHEHSGRVASRFDESPVRFTDRVLDGAVADGASIEEDMLCFGGCSCDGGEADESPHEDASRVVELIDIDLDELGFEFFADDCEGAFAWGLVWWEVKFDFVVTETADPDGGVGHRKVAEPFEAAGLLGGWGAEELSTCGGVEEQVADFDARPDGTAGWFGIVDRVPSGVDLASFVVVAGSRLDGDACD